MPFGMIVDDPDSLDAYADALDRAGITESYGDYCARMADEYAAEQAWNFDDWDEDGFHPRPVAAADDEPEPDPPAPVAAVLATIPCTECRATGTVRYSTGFGLSDWIEEPCSWCHGTGRRAACPACRGVPTVSGPACWYCEGSGLDHLAGEQSPAPAPVDRAEHFRRLGQTGGLTTYARYGSRHMAHIGRNGYAATVATHGKPYAVALLAGKGWQPRRPDLLADLRAGRELAALDRAA